MGRAPVELGLFQQTLVLPGKPSCLFLAVIARRLLILPSLSSPSPSAEAPQAGPFSTTPALVPSCPRVSESASIEFRASPIHGLGGFAHAAIPAGARVLEYVGERISKSESLRRCAAGNPFIFNLDEHWDLDGDSPANPARWLNHSCAPNCDAERLDDRLWIVSRRAIAAGEELTFDYGYALEELEEHPCRCGAPGCVGFIVAAEFHDLVRRKRGEG